MVIREVERSNEVAVAHRQSRSSWSVFTGRFPLIQPFLHTSNTVRFIEVPAVNSKRRLNPAMPEDLGESLERMGVTTERVVNVGSFTEGQKYFLNYHRDAALLRAVRT
jgi:hypothetical protein